MQEININEIKENEIYIIESINDDETFELTRQRVASGQPKRYQTVVKILKIEKPFYSFVNVWHQSKNFTRLDENADIKIYKPSKEFVKSLKTTCDSDF